MGVDIINSVLNTAAVSLEGIAALTSVLFYSKYKHTALRFFPIILIYVFINEIVAGYVFQIIGGKISILYNIYNIIFFLFFYYVFWNFVKNNKYRKLISIGAVLFLISCFISLFYNSFLTQPQIFSYVVGSCVLIFCIILYYIEILSTSRILLINKDLLFWISIGLLLFYVGYLPIKITRYYFTSQENIFITLQIVHRILIIIMNSCFIFGFIWTRRR